MDSRSAISGLAETLSESAKHQRARAVTTNKLLGQVAILLPALREILDVSMCCTRPELVGRTLVFIQERASKAINEATEIKPWIAEEK